MSATTLRAPSSLIRSWRFMVNHVFPCRPRVASRRVASGAGRFELSGITRGTLFIPLFLHTRICIYLSSNTPRVSRSRPFLREGIRAYAAVCTVRDENESKRLSIVVEICRCEESRDARWPN